MKKPTLIISASLLAAAAANAAVIVTTSETDARANFSPSSTDLAQTQLLSHTATGTDVLGTDATRRAEMFDGLLGDETNFDTNTAGSNFVRANSDNTVTLNFDISVNTLGYDITGIDTYFGWSPGGGGRSDQGYAVTVGFVGGSSATLINGQFWHDNSNTHTLVSITNDGGGALNSDTVNLNGAGAVADANVVATGVSSVTLSFQDLEDPGVAGEFDVFGVATVPEPSSAALLGLGGLALILRRRK